MAAIDFPNSPTVGQQLTVGDVSWEWTGTVWKSLGTLGVGPAGADGVDGVDGEADFDTFLMMGA